MNLWIQALKIFNKDSMWCMPRKGSAEHVIVKKIMDKLKSTVQKRIPDSASSKKETRKLRTSKEKKESEMMAMEDRDAPVTKRKLRTSKEKKESEMMAMEDRDAPVVKPVAKTAVKKPKKEKVEEEGYASDETRDEPLPDIYIDYGNIPKNIRNNNEERKKWLKKEYMYQYSRLALKTKLKILAEDYIYSSGNEGFTNLQLIREELEKLMKENPKSAKKIKKIIEEGKPNVEFRNKK